MSLVGKLFIKSFVHIWKDIMINQLRYPDHPLISVENQLVHKNFFFTNDVLACFKEWKLKALAKTDSSSDQCIWGTILLQVCETRFCGIVTSYY